jgi:uncharacterized protein (TIGR03085 family)
VTSHAAAERAALCDLLDSLGPNAPTLCEGWTTYDLAAHLAARDRVPASWPGLALARFTDRSDRVMQSMKSEHSYPEVVALVRRGAPVWNPMGAPIIREPANLLEYLVHHEDARRAQPGWTPRAVSTALADAVWSQLRWVARPAFRRARDGVVLHRAGNPDATITAKGGRLEVTVTGDPIELALFAFNRRSAARVDIRGDDAAIARLAAAQLGI